VLLDGLLSTLEAISHTEGLLAYRDVPRPSYLARHISLAFASLVNGSLFASGCLAAGYRGAKQKHRSAPGGAVYRAAGAVDSTPRLPAARILYACRCCLRCVSSSITACCGRIMRVAGVVTAQHYCALVRYCISDSLMFAKNNVAGPLQNVRTTRVRYHLAALTNVASVIGFAARAARNMLPRRAANRPPHLLPTSSTGALCAYIFWLLFSFSGAVSMA